MGLFPIQRRKTGGIFENSYFAEMCSGSEAGSYLRLIDFVYHSTLGLRVIKRDRCGVQDRAALGNSFGAWGAEFRVQVAGYQSVKNEVVQTRF